MILYVVHGNTYNLFSSIHAYRSALGMAVRKQSGYL